MHELHSNQATLANHLRPFRVEELPFGFVRVLVGVGTEERC